MALSASAHYEATAMDAANEYTPMFFCQDFSHCRVTLISASSANATVKLMGSGQVARPSLAVANGATNQIETVGFGSSDTPTTIIDGDTGKAWAGTDANYQVIVDCTNLRWLGAIMTARSAGSVKVYFDFFNKA